jgi:hypothetical protein
VYIRWSGFAATRLAPVPTADASGNVRYCVAVSPIDWIAGSASASVALRFGQRARKFAQARCSRTGKRVYDSWDSLTFNLNQRFVDRLH